jgi:phage shock protein PspC (stress-responsive transcriptional regulator)
MNPDATAESTGQVKQLVRLRDDRIVAGVCSGVAGYLGLDPTLVRLLAVLGVVFSFGAALVAYVVAWILMPEA